MGISKHALWAGTSLGKVQDRTSSEPEPLKSELGRLSFRTFSMTCFGTWPCDLSWNLCWGRFKGVTSFLAVLWAEDHKGPLWVDLFQQLDAAALWDFLCPVSSRLLHLGDLIAMSI